MKATRVGALTAATLGVLFMTPGVAAAAKVVKCGQKITASVKLANDVGPCPGDGLIVAKSGISIDLDGHTVTGASDASLDQVGIRILNVSDVEVENGTVQNFTAGVALENATGTTVRLVTAKDNRGTGASNHGDGILLDGANNNRILDNDVSGNGPYAGITLTDGASDNLVKGNNVHDNAVVRTEPVGQPPWSPPPYQDDLGVRLESGIARNVIEGNTIARNGSDGVANRGPEQDANIVRYNVIEGNGHAGVAGLGNNFTVSGNTIRANGFDQFRLPGASPGAWNGVSLYGNFGPGPGTIERNTIDGNAANGIQVYYPGFTFQGTYHPPAVYQIRYNTVSNNVQNGIFIMCDFKADAFPSLVCLTAEEDPPHVGEQVIGNIAFGNGGAGAGASAWDLYDQNGRCDVNTWHGNTAETYNPPCTIAS